MRPADAGVRALRSDTMTAADPTTPQPLTHLTPGMPLLVGGDHVVHVSDELAAAFRPGDRIIVVQPDGAVLHIPAHETELVTATVTAAVDAFDAMHAVSDTSISRFFELFADHLSDETAMAAILAANDADVDAARERGRSTTRLVLSDTMRGDMVAGLRTWSTMASHRRATVRTVEHDGWNVELMTDSVGVVGFVFEGRPNVFADACGVLRNGNTVVFRIGSDALGTARAIVEHALAPALRAAGLPGGAVGLVDSTAHAAGWALFADRRISLAVARGSGAAVRQLGAVARQHGVNASLHGTGGAWIIAGPQANPERLASAITASLDRKVCNTLNTLCLPRSRATELLPIALAAIDAAADRRSTAAKLHIVESDRGAIPSDRFAERTIHRASGPTLEAGCNTLTTADLGVEWEWEDSPEVSIALYDHIDEPLGWFRRHSPRFVASIIDDSQELRDEVAERIDAPFVGDGFTRWVDGQYALGTPELGLSNWENGRLFGRGGVLSGDSIVTVRARARQVDPDLSR